MGHAQARATHKAATTPAHRGWHACWHVRQPVVKLFRFDLRRSTSSVSSNLLIILFQMPGAQGKKFGELVACAEMIENMKRVASSDQELTVEERNLLSVVYKNVIERRSSASSPRSVRTSLTSLTSTSFYRRLWRIEGSVDYQYLAEFATGDKRQGSTDKSLAAYKAASDAVMTELAHTPHPPDRTCYLAKQAFDKQAFDGAIAELGTLSEESYKDSTLIMQLLRDNLTLWTSDMQDSADKPGHAKDEAGDAPADEEKIERELAKICEDILDVLTSTSFYRRLWRLKVFYHKLKMIGDYQYLAEFATGDKRQGSTDKSLAAYKAASDAVMTELAHTPHPPDRTCYLAKQAFDKQAFDGAIAELGTLSEESYKDSTLIMQLLRDNLTLWTSDMQDSADSPATPKTRPVTHPRTSNCIINIHHVSLYRMSFFILAFYWHSCSTK
ncbi:hypothetical protein D9611_012016 [Ephemerocybe angulata]|uniref:14-3-3 domain-containing protein n=1 Tax=Ephemerocybe angulata TaxID=980116 RepID=A0A8H5C3X6_9AGAR|nr:hypothetical protein D9611_012016 [Tulosesus angulatus]